MSARAVRAIALVALAARGLVACVPGDAWAQPRPDRCGALLAAYNTALAASGPRCRQTADCAIVVTPLQVGAAAAAPRCRVPVPRSRVAPLRALQQRYRAAGCVARDVQCNPLSVGAACDPSGRCVTRDHSIED